MHNTVGSLFAVTGRRVDERRDRACLVACTHPPWKATMYLTEQPVHGMIHVIGDSHVRPDQPGLH